MLKTNQHVESFQPQFLHKEAVLLLPFYYAQQHSSSNQDEKRLSSHTATMFTLKSRRNQTSELTRKSLSLTFLPHRRHPIPPTVALIRSRGIIVTASTGSDSEVTLYFTILEDRVSPADFTAAASAALLPHALDQEGPASSELSASSSSVVAHCYCRFFRRLCFSALSRDDSGLF